MKIRYVYVISKTGKKLMPTKRFGKVRRLLKSGRAKVIRRKPFTIQLLYATPTYTQPLILGIDPGGKEIGCIVRRETGEIVYAGELECRSVDVAKNMAERRMYRRSRRKHRRVKRKRRAKKSQTVFAQKEYKIPAIREKIVCKDIKPKLIRIHNRVREKGWLTPTAHHLLASHKALVKRIQQLLPISKVMIEYGEFDIHKLQVPTIKGKEYQKGIKKGYENTQAYVLCRDKHTCQLCKADEKKNRSPVLEVHHVIWRNQGGSDLPENLITLCQKCHQRVHKNAKKDKQVKEIFKGMAKRYVHTTLLNSIMPRLYKWLCQTFKDVFITYGYETKGKRRQLNLPKSHYLDAYLISLKDETEFNEDWQAIEVYKYKQFRRHHRQIIHAIRDRNYKQGDKIVAQNRNKRTGQLSNSLSEWVKNKGQKALAGLRVLTGKKVKRSAFYKFAKGDVVKYKGLVYVVKGYGEMGRRLGFVNQKQYVPARDCKLIMRNTGMVCL
jgi:hypothetical protein